MVLKKSEFPGLVVILPAKYFNTLDSCVISHNTETILGKDPKMSHLLKAGTICAASIEDSFWIYLILKNEILGQDITVNWFSFNLIIDGQCMYR